MSRSDRPSFDPTRARGAAGASLFGNSTEPPDQEQVSPDQVEPDAGKSDSTRRNVDRPWTVSEVADRIGRVLLEHLPRKVRVIGEISNLSTRNHWYFSLKDEQAIIGCIAWASKARAFGFDAENGMQVVATGSIQFYAPQGRCQLYVDKLEPVGAGALELRFRALCEELRGLGYFDPARKKEPPIFPRRVAVITSETGAALQDVLDTLRRRCPAIEVLLADVRVQGAEAAGEITRALRQIARRHEDWRIDAVIITRGGGSIEDLWAFNEREVAEALLDFPIPTIAAIGHETDTTIAELVADVRCATPTQAAMLVSPDRSELAVQLDHAARRIRLQIEQQLRYHAERLRYVERHLLRPEEILSARREHLDAMVGHLHHAFGGAMRASSQRIDRAAIAIERIRPHRITAARLRRLDFNRFRLKRAMQDRIGDAQLNSLQRRRMMDATMTLAVGRSRTRAEQAHSLLQSIDPTRVLHRGYSITRNANDRRIIRRADDVNVGDRLITRVADGIINSEAIDARDARLEDRIEEQRPAKAHENQPSGSSALKSESVERDPRDDSDQLDLFGNTR